MSYRNQGYKGGHRYNGGKGKGQHGHTMDMMDERQTQSAVSYCKYGAFLLYTMHFPVVDFS